MLLEHIEHATSARPDASIIWLHGLGADGNDFAGIVQELHLPSDLGIRFIFPHAPYRPISLNNGYVMRGWYDLASLDIGSTEDALGIAESADQINDFIRHEIQRGIQPHRIILAGFSQGGAIALHTGLRYPQRLAGILALSTYLPLIEKVADEASAANKDIPIYMAHGEYDPIVPLPLARQSHRHLKELGYHIDWHVYPMEHSVSPAEIDDISTWFGNVLR